MFTLLSWEHTISGERAVTAGAEQGLHIKFAAKWA